MLLQLSQIFPLYPHHPPLPHAIPTLLFRSMGHGISSWATPFPVLYFTSPWLFCNYQFVLLNPLTSSLISPSPAPIWQPSEHSAYP